MRARAGYLLLLVSLVLGLAGCRPHVVHLPTPTAIKQGLGRPTPTPAPNITPQPQLLERRLLILEWPETIREKDSDLIVLTIAMDQQGQSIATMQASGNPDGTRVEIPNLYSTHNIVAIARLDMAGVEAYREEIREPMRPGESLTFRWSIRASEAGDYRGVVWLRLELVPKAGGATEEMLLLARQIEVRAITVLGLPADLARILGGAGLVLSTVLGYPFIQGRVEEWLKRRKGKGLSASKSGSREVYPPKKAK
jgi:hypothetical protein